MGLPKALLSLESRTLLETAVGVCRECGLWTWVVLGFEADRIRTQVALGDARILVNPDPDLGQSSSVVCGARAALGAGLLCVLPVDHALLEAKSLRGLLRSFDERGQGIEIVVPSDGVRRGHPALVSSAIIEELASLASDRPAHDVIRRDPARILHVFCEDPAAFEDIDTPEDWQAVLARHRARPGGGSP